MLWLCAYFGIFCQKMVSTLQFCALFCKIQVVRGEPKKQTNKQLKTILTKCKNQVCSVNRKPPNFRVDLFGSANSWVESACFAAFKYPVKPTTYYIGYRGSMNVDPSKKIVAHLILLDGNFHLLVCKTVHIPPGPKKVGSSRIFRPLFCLALL